MRNEDRRKKNRRKRIIRAYLLRGLVLAVLAIVLFLMGCGFLYIKERLTGTSNTVSGDTAMASGELNQSSTLDDGELVVVLDAGHGGNDNGTSYGKNLEKDITLSVVNKIQSLLEEKNVKVVLTRDSDTYISLSDRTTIANEANADVFVSIHCNYYEKSTSINGLECYYSSSSTIGKSYASFISKAVAAENTIDSRGSKTANFYVLRNTEIPAVLVELGYLSNTSDRAVLIDSDSQQALAEQIVNGILAAQ